MKLQPSTAQLKDRDGADEGVVEGAEVVVGIPVVGILVGAHVGTFVGAETVGLEDGSVVGALVKQTSSKSSQHK